MQLNLCKPIVENHGKIVSHSYNNCVIWPEVTFLSPYTLRDCFEYFACYSRIDLGSSISDLGSAISDT